MRTLSLPKLASVHMSPSWLALASITLLAKKIDKVICVCFASKASRLNFDEIKRIFDEIKRIPLHCKETGSSGQCPQNGQVSLRSAKHSKLMGKTLAGLRLKGASTGKSHQKEVPQAPGKYIIQAHQPR